MFASLLTSPLIPFAYKELSCANPWTCKPWKVSFNCPAQSEQIFPNGGQYTVTLLQQIEKKVYIYKVIKNIFNL